MVSQVKNSKLGRSAEDASGFILDPMERDTVTNTNSPSLLLFFFKLAQPSEVVALSIHTLYVYVSQSFRAFTSSTSVWFTAHATFSCSTYK